MSPQARSRPPPLPGRFVPRAFFAFSSSFVELNGEPGWPAFRTGVEHVPLFS